MEKNKTNCIFCSLGCGLKIRVDGTRVIETDFDFADPVNEGSICPRGNYVLEMLKNKSRIGEPSLMDQQGAKKCSWDEAFAYCINQINFVRQKYGNNSIGVIASPMLSLDSLKLAADFVNNSLDSDNFEIFGVSRENIAAIDETEGDIARLKEQEVLLLVGDVLTRSPVLSKAVNRVKYGARANKVITIDFRGTHTSWFSTMHLQVNPGGEAFALAALLKVILDKKHQGQILSAISMETLLERSGLSAGQVKEAAAALEATPKAAIVAAPILDDPQVIALCAMLAAAAGKTFVPLYSAGNYAGAKSVLQNARSSNVVDLLLKGQLKGLVLLGEDLLRSIPKKIVFEHVKKLHFLIQADVFLGLTSKYANIFLPACSPFEENTEMIYSGKRRASLEKVIGSVGNSKTYAEILSYFISKMSSGKTMPLIASAGRTSGAREESVIKQLENIPDVKTDEEHPYLLVPFDDITHVGNGSQSSNFLWAKSSAKNAYIEINPSDADNLGLKTWDKAIVRSKIADVNISVRVSESIPKGVVSASHHFPDVRKLFTSDNAANIEPVKISRSN